MSPVSGEDGVIQTYSIKCKHLDIFSLIGLNMFPAHYRLWRYVQIFFGIKLSDINRERNLGKLEAIAFIDVIIKPVCAFEKRIKNLHCDIILGTILFRMYGWTVRFFFSWVNYKE